MASEVVPVKRASWAGIRIRHPMALAMAGALILTTLTAALLHPDAAAAGTARTAGARPDAGKGVGVSAAPKPVTAPQRADQGPWQKKNYVPRPGQWRPYVLAPSSRTVPALAVAGAVANQGSITNPNAAIP